MRHALRVGICLVFFALTVSVVSAPVLAQSRAISSGVWAHVGSATILRGASFAVALKNLRQLVRTTPDARSWTGDQVLNGSAILKTLPTLPDTRSAKTEAIRLLIGSGAIPNAAAELASLAKTFNVFSESDFPIHVKGLLVDAVRTQYTHVISQYSALRYSSKSPDWAAYIRSIKLSAKHKAALKTVASVATYEKDIINLSFQGYDNNIRTVPLDQALDTLFAAVDEQRGLKRLTEPLRQVRAGQNAKAGQSIRIPIFTSDSGETSKIVNLVVPAPSKTWAQDLEATSVLFVDGLNRSRQLIVQYSSDLEKRFNAIAKSARALDTDVDQLVAKISKLEKDYVQAVQSGSIDKAGTIAAQISNVSSQSAQLRSKLLNAVVDITQAHRINRGRQGLKSYGSLAAVLNDGTSRLAPLLASGEMYQLTQSALKSIKGAETGRIVPERINNEAKRLAEIAKQETDTLSAIGFEQVIRVTEGKPAAIGARSTSQEDQTPGHSYVEDRMASPELARWIRRRRAELLRASRLRSAGIQVSRRDRKSRARDRHQPPYWLSSFGGYSSDEVGRQANPNCFAYGGRFYCLEPDGRVFDPDKAERDVTIYPRAPPSREKGKAKPSKSAGEDEDIPLDVCKAIAHQGRKLPTKCWLKLTGVCQEKLAKGIYATYCRAFWPKTRRAHYEESCRKKYHFFEYNPAAGRWISVCSDNTRYRSYDSVYTRGAWICPNCPNPDRGIPADGYISSDRKPVKYRPINSSNARIEHSGRVSMWEMSSGASTLPTFTFPRIDLSVVLNGLAPDWQKMPRGMRGPVRGKRRSPRSAGPDGYISSQRKRIGGVELGRAQDLKVDRRVASVDINEKTGDVTFLGADGNRYKLVRPLRPQILRNLLHLSSICNDIFNFSFTLPSISKAEEKRVQAAIDAYYSKNRDWLIEKAHRSLKRGRQYWVMNVPQVKWRKHVKHIGCGSRWRDTLIGKIAFEADVALKTAKSTFNPVTGKYIKGSKRYHAAVLANLDEGGFEGRIWLYLKSAKLNIIGEHIRLSVKVGIKTKKTAYVDNYNKIDIGDTPPHVQNLISVMMDEYDNLGKQIPSLHQLKEVYRALAVFQIMERLGINYPKNSRKYNITKYNIPQYYERIATIRMHNRGQYADLFKDLSGGADLRLRNKFNNKITRDNNLFSEIDQFAKNSGNNSQYNRAWAHFKNWDLTAVIKQTTIGLARRPFDPDLLNLRANGNIALAMNLSLPQNPFDPSQLADILGDELVQKLNNGALEMALPTTAIHGVTRAIADFARIEPNGNFVKRDNSRLARQLFDAVAQSLVDRQSQVATREEKEWLTKQAAEIFTSSGNFRKAAQRYELLTHFEPESLTAHSHLANALLKDAKSRYRPANPRVPMLMLPLNYAARDGPDTWLSRGLVSALYEASRSHKQLDIVPLEALDRITQTSAAKDSISAATLDADTAAKLSDVAARFILSGAYKTLGHRIRISMSLLDRTNNKTTKFSTRGSLRYVRNLIHELHRNVLLAVSGKSTGQILYEDFPRTKDGFKVWAQLRDPQTAPADKMSKWSFVGVSSDGRLELGLYQSDRLYVQGRFSAALARLRGLGIDQADARVQKQIGKLLFVLGDAEGARRRLHAAHEAEPDEAGILLLLREIATASDDRLRYLDRLIDLQYHDNSIFLEAASLWLSRGEKIRSLKALVRLMRSAERLTDRELAEIDRQIRAIAG